jgi:hypothetical protein
MYSCSEYSIYVGVSIFCCGIQKRKTRTEQNTSSLVGTHEEGKKMDQVVKSTYLDLQ